MKAIALLFIPVLFLTNKAPQKQTTKSTYYYFCVSHSMERVKDKEVILYTDVAEYNGETNGILTETSRWADYVKSKCENPSGCTSDLNYYPTKEAAMLEYEKTVKHYSDESRYLLKRVTYK